MTNRELQNKLKEFPDNFIVLVPTTNENKLVYTTPENVARGVNEFDCCIFIDDYIEEKENE